MLDERGDRLVEQANLGYVVIDERFIPPDRAAMVIAAFKLREVQRDAHLTLYVPQVTTFGERGLLAPADQRRLKPSLSKRPIRTRT